MQVMNSNKKAEQVKLIAVSSIQQPSVPRNEKWLFPAFHRRGTVDDDEPRDTRQVAVGFAFLSQHSRLSLTAKFYTVQCAFRTNEIRPVSCGSIPNQQSRYRPRLWAWWLMMPATRKIISSKRNKGVLFGLRFRSYLTACPLSPETMGWSFFWNDLWELVWLSELRHMALGVLCLTTIPQTGLVNQVDLCCRL